MHASGGVGNLKIHVLFGLLDCCKSWSVRTVETTGEISLPIIIFVVSTV